MFKKTDEQIKKELEKCNEYLKKLRKLIPGNPKVKGDTLALLYAIRDIKTSININTIVMAICFVGLGIVVAVT